MQNEMTRRDWFAGMAMEGLIAAGCTEDDEELAGCAAWRADRLIEELDRTADNTGSPGTPGSNNPPSPPEAGSVSGADPARELAELDIWQKGWNRGFECAVIAMDEARKDTESYTTPTPAPTDDARELAEAVGEMWNVPIGRSYYAASQRVRQIVDRILSAPPTPAPDPSQVLPEGVKREDVVWAFECVSVSREEGVEEKDRAQALLKALTQPTDAEGGGS